LLDTQDNKNNKYIKIQTKIREKENWFRLFEPVSISYKKIAKQNIVYYKTFTISIKNSYLPKFTHPKITISACSA